MHELRPYAWLLVGLVIAILVPAADLDAIVLRSLSSVAAVPWADAALAAMLFWCAAGFYFRSGWASQAEKLRQERRRQGAAARLLREAILDGRRSLGIMRENLQMVVDGDQRPADARMYLSGARSHVDKLEQVFERASGIRRRLAVDDTDE